MKNDPYIAYALPKDGYTKDEELQSRLTSRSKFVDRIMMRIFIGFVLVFLSSIALMMWVHPLFVFGCIAAGATLPLAGLILLPPPKTLCSECEKKMTKEYELINADTARYGEFLVCNHCQRYAYTHRASRP
jgi:hypothetical protein